MLQLSSKQSDMAKDAFYMVLKRNKKYNHPLDQQSVLLRLSEIHVKKKDDKYINYFKSQIICSIIFPIATLFFLSHDVPKNKRCREDMVEELAHFIELNTLRLLI